MPTQMNEVVQLLRRAVSEQAGAGLTDRQLLGCFIEHRDEAAVATLVRRHGPMVWGVCRRVLGDHHDAEDAFQATFLVLVRRAASVRPRDMVGNFLYGVAHQTALKARALRARRRARERQVAEMPEPEAVRRDDADELQAVLDQELNRLPEMYRAAIVLCDLEGRTRKEAARQLGLPEGTLAGRLTRGRALLGKRLARNGAVLSVGSVAALLSQSAVSAGVPASVMSSTIRVATLLAAGAAASAISGPVAALTEGVLKAMLLTRVKTVLGIGLALGVLLLGSVFAYRTSAADRRPPAPPKDRLEDTLILLDKQWWEAATRHDVDTMGRILADDWVAAGPDPSADWTKAMSLDYYRRVRFVDVKFLSARRVVRVDEHTAMMNYDVKWLSQEKGKGPRGAWDHARVIHCWVQRDGGWFIKYTGCVSLPVPPEPPPASRLAPLPPDLTMPLTVEPVPPDIKFSDPIIIDRKAAPKPEPAWKKGVRASGTWQNEIPENAFDGRRDTDWNAGDYAPAWIERDLGALLPLSSITLFPAQDIPGVTVHEVWVSNEPMGDQRSKAKLVHTFKGHTTNHQALKFEFPKDQSARYVEIRTTTSPTWIAWWEIEIRVRDEKVVPPVPKD
jgi:RNA polymerase sigma factor (sigma-70 family)